MSRGEFIISQEIDSAWLNVGERIVRCRDCKYNDPEHEDNWRNWENACFMFADYEGTPADVEPDGFCAWGKRRG